MTVTGPGAIPAQPSVGVAHADERQQRETGNRTMTDRVFVVTYVTHDDITGCADDSKWRTWYEELTEPGCGLALSAEGARKLVDASHDEALQAVLDDWEYCTEEPKPTLDELRERLRHEDSDPQPGTPEGWLSRAYLWKAGQQPDWVEETFAYAHIFTRDLHP